MPRLLPLLALGLLLPAPPAAAHQTAASRMEVSVRTQEAEVDLLLVVPTADLADELRLPPDVDPAAVPSVRAYLDGHLGVEDDGTPCLFGEVVLRPSDPPTHLLYLATARCEAPLGRVSLRNTALLETPGGYRHLARIQVGADVGAVVFDGASPTHAVQVGPKAPAASARLGLAGSAEGHSAAAGPLGRGSPEGLLATVLDFGRLGILHILLGWDHVLFVLLLLVAARTARDLLGVVTAFTAAHTLTLVLSALGVVSVPPAVVEPAIALSIAWVAIENLRRPRAGGHRLAVVFAFGLVHGFGFSYVLRDEIGLPPGALVPALLSFNVGVELGQLALVVPAFPLVRRLRERPGARTVFVGASAIAFALAGWWFVERVFLA